MRFFLSGVSCVSKTTIGKRLADEIEYKIFDLDCEVESYYDHRSAQVLEAELRIYKKEFKN